MRIARKLGELLGMGRRADGGFHSFEHGWHPLLRSKTGSGETVSVESAGGLSAVHCATRIITEALAMLPFNLRRHIDNRNTETAYGHPLQNIIHSQPNRDQNRFTFFDTLVPQQINAGNAYAEIQRENGRRDGKVMALWPIHNTRVTVKRGPIKGENGKVYGIDGTLVYTVRANDGTTYGLEQWEMLHVPGIMSGDGVTGKGLVDIAAESLGAIQATEKHVSSYFKNGASPDLVISIKSPVPPEERQNLRTSLQAKHAGAANAHKTMLLFGDTEVEQVGVDPQKLMLIDMRRFGVAEVSRFWRTPMHMLSELGRATWANIEDQGQDFVIYCFGPWVVRWELALNCQLLTEEEREEYFFKANLNALLRGNSAARIAYYNARFDRGSLTINEIRESEDENPLPYPEADKPMIQGNNYVPLDRIGDVATLNASQPAVPDEPDDDTEDDAEDARKIALDVSRGCLTVTLKGLMEYEARAAMQKSETKQFADWIVTFYDGKFRETFKSQVGPIVERASKLGIQMTCDDLADLHCNTSRFQIDSCLNKTRAEFLPSLKSLFETWTHRAEDEANAAFGIAGDA